MSVNCDQHLDVQNFEKLIDSCYKDLNHKSFSLKTFLSGLRSTAASHPQNLNNTNGKDSTEKYFSSFSKCSIDIIHNFINKDYTAIQRKLSGGYNGCRQIQHEHDTQRLAITHDGQGVYPLYHCVLLRLTKDTLATNDISPSSTLWGIAMVHFSYSTWKGRCLSISRFAYAKEANPSEELMLTSLLLRSIVNLGNAINCSRIVWQTHDPKAVLFYEKIGAEVLKEWLTLHMDKDGLNSFLQTRQDWKFCQYQKYGHTGNFSKTSSELSSQIYQDQLNKSTIDEIVDTCLVWFNAVFVHTRCTISTDKDGKKSKITSFLRMRRATQSDSSHIFNLVKGLAIFERDLEAVTVTEKDYERDGFRGDRPLFHCILLEEVKLTDYNYNGELKNDGDNNFKDTESSSAIGMAFWYLGYSLSNGHAETRDNGDTINDETGRFLYLEDLFIEDAYRRRGGGRAMMYALADICRKLNCISMVWQALDWNTPALAFYEAIGAKIIKGCVTLRFDKIGMKQFSRQCHDQE